MNLIEAIEMSWSRETSFDPDNWTIDNPAWGQCSVTALVLQDYLGGDLLSCEIADSPHYYSHYYNQIEGWTLDITRKQFVPFTKFYNYGYRDREFLLDNKSTADRYSLLAVVIIAKINQSDWPYV